jgi:phosphoserine phosphatase
MKYVLTLAVNSEFANLDTSSVAVATEALAKAGASLGAPDWLADDIACDIPFDSISPTTADTLIRAQLTDVDIFAQPQSGRRKSLLLSDMDATMVTCETLDELADFAGKKNEIAEITARAMNGEIAYDDSLRQRVAMLAGLSVDSLEKTLVRMELTPGARTLVQTMRKNGAFTALVSSGFKFFTRHIREQIGFHEDVSNEFEIKDGTLTGEIDGTIMNKDGKLSALRRFVEQQGVALSDAVTVGDGANDLPMLQAAGLGIAFHAKPVVAASAQFQIKHSDLTSVLYAQGYKRNEFVD